MNERNPPNDPNRTTQVTEEREKLRQRLAAETALRKRIDAERRELERKARFGVATTQVWLPRSLPPPMSRIDRPATLCPFRAFRLPSGQDILLGGPV